MPNLIDRYIPTINGETSGDIPQKLMSDWQFLAYHQPYLPTRGPNADIACVTINMKDKNGNPWTTNEKGQQVPIRRQVRVIDAINAGVQVPLWALNSTSMRRDDWIQTQEQVEVAYRNQLKLISVLQGSVSVPGGGWGALTYEYDAMSDAHEAIVDMDGLSEGRGDAPLFLPRSVPQPFTHCDYYYSDRFIAASKMKGRPGNDVLSAEQAGRRIAEVVEDTAIGVKTGLTYGTRTGYFAHDLTSTWFGLTNYTNRNTKTNMTAPTTGGWVPNTLLNEILAAIQTLQEDNVPGPFGVFYSRPLNQYLNQVFSISGGNSQGETLRTMLMKNPDISSVERLDRLAASSTDYTIIIQALDRKYIVFIDGMGVRTWQWPTRGGMQQNFRVGVVQSTLPKSDYTGNCGTMIMTTS